VAPGEEHEPPATGGVGGHEPAPLEDAPLDPPKLPPLPDVLPPPELLPPDDEEAPSSAAPSGDASPPVPSASPPSARMDAASPPLPGTDPSWLAVVATRPEPQPAISARKTAHAARVPSRPSTELGLLTVLARSNGHARTAARGATWKRCFFTIEYSRRPTAECHVEPP
jgi:hypothetical protein